MILGNHFTLAYVFGKHRKLGQTEINFCVDHKIPLPSWKWISVSILPSNEFQDSQTEREREGDSKKREHRWFAQPSSSIVHRSLITAQPSFNTNTHHQSLISTHPSLITDPQTPKTHLFDRQPCTDGYRLSSNLDNRPQVVLQRRHHLDWSLASCSCCHHPRPILFSTHPRPLSSPPLKTDLSFPIYLSFPQSLNLSLLDLWFFLLLLWWCGRWCFGGFCVVWWWVLCG